MSPWAVREVCEIGTLVVRFAHWRLDPHTGITESRSAPAADHRTLRRLVALDRPTAWKSARTKARIGESVAKTLLSGMSPHDSAIRGPIAISDWHHPC